MNHFFPNRFLFIVGTFVAVTIFTAGSTAFAAEGRTPISACTTLTQSGSYLLTQNIIADGTVCPCIQINADNVTLDLGGHSIQVTSTTGCNGIQSSGKTGITVRNGLISGAYHGIFLRAPGGYLRIEKMTIINVSFYGILLEGDIVSPCSNYAHAIVTDNIINQDPTSTTTQAGLALLCISGARVERNQIKDIVKGISGGEIYNTLIAHNVIMNNNFEGIKLSTGVRNILMNNVTTGNGFPGISMRDNSKYNIVKGNNTSSNNIDGIRLISSTYNTIRENTSSNNENGINLAIGSTGNSIEWNYISNSTGSGSAITFDSSSCGNVLGYNRFHGLSVIDACTPPNTRLDYVGDTNN